MRFSNTLPLIECRLPTVPDTPDRNVCSLTFYIFNKGVTAENTGEGHDYFLYAKEAAYAYRQLVRNTNILDCGRVRFFVDRRCAAKVEPYFRAIGIESLIVWIDVPTGVRLSNYIAHFDDPSIADCRYNFHCDTDFWFINLLEKKKGFDWQRLCDTLDEVLFFDTYLLGMPIEKPNFDYLCYYGQHLAEDQLTDRAKQVFIETFGEKIPTPFSDIVDVSIETLKANRHLSALQSIAGWFVGLKNGSLAKKRLIERYRIHGDNYPSDEGFYALYLYLEPRIERYPILVDYHLADASRVPKIDIQNITETIGYGFLNVGAHDFLHPDYAQTASRLKEYFR